MSAGITEYGHDPFIPNEVYDSRTNDRFDTEPGTYPPVGERNSARGMHRFAYQDDAY